MSGKRNRKPRKNRSRRTTRKISSSGGARQRRPQARSGTPSSVVRRGIGGQDAGRVSTVPGDGHEDPATPREAVPTYDGVAEAARTTPATPPTWPGTRRRMTLSSIVLLGIVALEVAALAVLGIHFASGGAQVATVSSSPTYAPPVQLAVGTAYVRSTVVAPNTIVVTHWIHTQPGVYSVRIQVPRVQGLAPQALEVTDLVVVSDGRSIPAATLQRGRRVQTYTVPAGSHFYVSYVLTGPIEPSSSPSGPTPSMITALGVSTPPAQITRTVQRVVGAPVLGLACSARRPKAVGTPCGQKVGSAWRVDLRGTHSADRVMVRMNRS